MSKKGNLLKNTIIIFVGKACTQFISLLLLPLYTAVLDSSEYGIADLVTTYITLLVPLITLQLEMATFRFLIDNRNKDEENSKIISTSFILCNILTLIIIFIAFLVNCFYEIPYFIYIVFLLFSTVLSNYALQVCRGLGDNVSYSIGCFITGTITIFLNLLFLLVFKLGLIGLFAAQALANFICFLYVLLRKNLWKKIHLRYLEKNRAKEMLKYSLPLIPNGLIWWIINASDRTIISIFMNASANGIYAVSNKFSNIIVQIYNVFNLSWTESASVHINDNDKAEFFSETMNDIISIFSSMGILMIAFMPVVFPFMVNSEFNEAYIYIPFLVIGILFNIIVSFVGGIYVALKNTKKIASTSFWSGVINILINVILIKKIGIFAAAISTIIAFLVMSIFRVIDIRKQVNLKLNVRNITAIIFIFALSICLYYQKNTIAIAVNIIVCLAFSIKLNIDKVKLIVKKCKQVISKKA